jgi:hypothetical protein
MSTLVLHAGRGKTGSSSIQRWLAREAKRLQSEHGVHVLVATNPSAPGGSQVVACQGGSAKSSLGHWPFDAARAEMLFTSIERALDRHGTVVLSSEGFGRWFYEANPEVLSVLQDLALRHDVKVAYYVRPQHANLESAWRQWGFRTGCRPSEFVLERVPFLDHTTALDRVRDVAPRIFFVVRPFRRDLLIDGDVVVDFATTFLGVPDLKVSSEDRDNVGFSLELVNMLQHAPPNLFWTSPHDNRMLAQLRRIGAAEWPITESSKSRDSRELLQAFCHQRYEQGNQQLIRCFDWHTDHFVPPVAGFTDRAVDVTELDRLWEPDASEAELELLFHALSALLESNP